MKTLREQMILHEGNRRLPYMDTVGILTIGIGHNLNNGLSQSAINLIFDEDMNDVLQECEKYHWFPGLSDVRKRVVMDMMFNLGPLRFSQFKQTIALIAQGDYVQASRQMVESKWAKQVGKRAKRLAHMMEHDVPHPDLE